MLDFIDIVALDSGTIKKSLLSKHKDFEDAIQIFAANSISKIDYIVTRNLKDFKATGILVLPPDDFLKQL